MISGNVKTENGTPIPNVNVTLTDCSIDSAIITFNQSDSKGNYTIVFPDTLNCAQLYLEFTSIGFKKQTRTIKDSNLENEKLVFDIQMAESVFELEEVIIRQPQKSFQVKKDTTIYQVNKYATDGQEKMEDVLKKMPGIDVDQNGVISYNGKIIDKILVDGDEFFSKNYTVLSKNVNSNLVDQVEAIDNYNDNNVLKGISISDKTILNFKLNEKSKASLFGSVDFGLGSNKRYLLNTSLFSFVKKNKIGFISNINNISQDALGATEYDLNQNYKEFVSAVQLTGNIIPVGYSLPIAIDYNDKQYVLNSSETGALQFNRALSKKINLNFNTIFNFDKKFVDKTSETTYLNFDTVYNYLEDGNFILKPTYFKTNINLDYEVNPASLINYQASFSSIKTHYLFDVLFNNINVNEDVKSTYSEFLRDLSQSLTYSFRINKTSAFSFEAFLNLDNVKANNNIDTNRFTDFIIADYTSLDQKLNRRSNESSLAAKYYTIFNRHTFNANLRYNGISNNMLNERNFSFAEENDKPVLNTQYDIKGVYIELQDLMRFGKFDLTALLRLGRPNFSFSNNEGLIQKKNWYFLPKFTVKFSPSLYTYLRFNFERKDVYSNISDIYPNLLLYNYSTFYKSYPVLNKNTQNTVSFNFKHSDDNRQLDINFQSLYQNMSSPYVPSLFFKANFFINNNIANLGSTYYFTNKFYIDKYIPFLRSTIRTGGSFSSNKIISVINENRYNNLLNTYNYNIRLSTTFKGALNFSGSVSDYYYVVAGTVNNTVKYSIDTKYKITKNTNLLLRSNFYRVSLNNNINNSLFTDASVKYNGIKRLSLNLSASNITQQNSIIYNSASNYYNYTSSLRLFLFILCF